jgi:prepilin-type N-terminal cleavage/methylation domain-containing protein
MSLLTKNQKTYSASEGFTIIELMIATMVFGVILLVVATAVMEFSHIYYKGVTEDTVQTTARNVVDTIGQNIQLDGGNVIPGTAYGISSDYCIGDQRYSYLLGHELADVPTGTQYPHALVVDSIAGCGSSTQAQDLTSTSITAGSRELLAPNMRLSAFAINSLGNGLYQVHVKIVYGDDDLLVDPTGTDATCQNVYSGTQFCAIADVSTTVIRRIGE